MVTKVVTEEGRWLAGLGEIARHCRIHRDTLRKKWMKEFAMPIIKIRGRWYSSVTQLEEWLAFPYLKARSQASPNPPHTSPKTSLLKGGK